MRVIVAARLSQLQKDGREGLGLDTQDSRSRAWAEREGHDVLAVVADTKSGTVAPWDRKNLRPWVTDPERVTEYDGIVAFKNDRLSRGCWADEARIRLWAEEHGKTLMIVDGPQWPPRHDGDKWSWEAQASQARKEWEAGRERSMRAQAELRDRGALVGRYPWGYASTGEKYSRTMTATDEGQRLVPEMYWRVADGESLSTVAAWLTGQTGRTWWPRTLAATIRNPTYRGEHRSGTGRTIHRCPALVDGDTWRRAVAALDSRPGNRRGQRNDLATGAAMLSGLICCANPECTSGPDSPMYKIRTRDQEFYRCSGRGAQRKGCGNMVPLAAVDALMDRAMAGLRRPVMRVVLHPATGHQAELDDITQALRDLPAQELDEDAEDAERARLRAERKRLSELPASPAWAERIETGETYGQKWERSGQAERRAWLRDAGFALYAGKPGMVPAVDEDPAGTLSRVDTYESDAAWLTFIWTGDEDAGLGRGLAA